MGTITEKLVIVIDSRTGGAIKGLREVETAASSAERSALKSGSSSGILARGLERVGLSSATSARLAAAGIAATGAAIGVVVATVASGIKSYVALADQIRAVKSATGANAEVSSKLAAVLRATGTDTDTFAAATSRLAKTLGANPEALKKYGVETARTKQGNVDVAETFLRVGDAYRGTTDQAQRALIGAAALGKGYTALIPVLARTRAEQEALARQADSRGQILSQDELDKARNLQREMKNLGAEVEAFKQSTGKSSVAPLGAFLGQLSVGLATARNLASGQGLVEASTRAVREHQVAVLGVVAAERALGVQQREVADSQAFQKQRSEANTLRSALLGVIGAQDSVRDAEKRVASTTDDVAVARKKLNDLVAKGTVDNQKVTSSTRELTSALHGQQEAQDRVIDLQKALNDLLKPASAGDLTDAALNITAATLAQADAQKQLVEATKAAANAGTFGTSKDQEKADDDLAKAHLGVEQAARSLQRAEEDQDRVRKIGQPNSEAVTRAQRELAEAHDQVQVATENVADREQALRDAQAPDQARIDAITSARKTLADAIDTQKQAVSDLPGKIEAEANAQASLNVQIGAAPEAAAAYLATLDQLAGKSPGVATLRDRINDVLASSQGLANHTPEFVAAADARAAAIARMVSAAGAGFYQSGQAAGPSRSIADVLFGGPLRTLRTLGGAVGIGRAAGGIIPATPGGQLLRVGEAGAAEVILSTDPRYARRNADLLVGSGLAKRGGGSGGGPISVEINQHFSGNPDREEVRAGTADGLAELERAVRAR